MTPLSPHSPLVIWTLALIALSFAGLWFIGGAVVVAQRFSNFPLTAERMRRR
jgi:hypothetical protein